MTTSINELSRMSHEEAEHRCFERMIDAAIVDLKVSTAVRYQYGVGAKPKGGITMTKTYSISSYCSWCRQHVHLTLTGTELEVRQRRDTYVCAGCIVNEIEEVC